RNVGVKPWVAGRTWRGADSFPVASGAATYIEPSACVAIRVCTPPPVKSDTATATAPFQAGSADSDTGAPYWPWPSPADSHSCPPAAVSRSALPSPVQSATARGPDGWCDTVNGTGALVTVWPAASVTVAVSVCGPSDSVEGSSEPTTDVVTGIGLPEESSEI